jgi:hypothetical protein
MDLKVMSTSILPSIDPVSQSFVGICPNQTIKATPEQA